MFFKSKNKDKSLEIKSLKSLKDGDFTIVDVRNDKDKYQNDKFIGLDVIELEEKYLTNLEPFVPKLKDDRTYVIVCYKGIRSRTVAGQLRDMGVKNVCSFTGGYAKFAAQ